MHEGRALDAMQIGEHVEGAALAARSGGTTAAPRSGLTARRAMSGSRGMRGIDSGKASSRQASTAGLVRMAVNLRKRRRAQRADLRPAEALEQRHAPLEVWRLPAASVLIRISFGRVRRVARGVGQRDHAAERGAEHDRID